MSKIQTLTAFAFLTVIPTLAPAQEGNFINRQKFTLPVHAIDAHTFEVIEADGAGGTQFWCAAGIYARKVLGQRGKDITIQRERAGSTILPGRKSVIFTTEPVTGAFSSFDQGVRRTGKVFSSGHANALCGQFNGVRVRLDDGTLVRR